LRSVPSVETRVTTRSPSRGRSAAHARTDEIDDPYRLQIHCEINGELHTSPARSVLPVAEVLPRALLRDGAAVAPDDQRDA
jgi:hypothetical protein